MLWSPSRRPGVVVCHSSRAAIDILTVPDCKSLAPTWEALAEIYDRDSEKVMIVKVDADSETSKAVAARFGVKSFPTIKYFPQRSQAAENYESGRSKEDFVDFVNEKAGTMRLVSGRLNEKAGLVDSLESAMKASGLGNPSDLLQTMKEAKNGLNDQYFPYYLRTLEKLLKDETFIEKELARIQKILQKGNVAMQKMDDLVSRSNILNSFQRFSSQSKQEL